MFASQTANTTENSRYNQNSWVVLDLLVPGLSAAQDGQVGTLLLIFEGIEKRNATIFKISNIASSKREIIHVSSCSYQ